MARQKLDKHARKAVLDARKQVEEPDEEYGSSALSPKEVEGAMAMLQEMVRYGQGRHYRGFREGLI